MEGQIERVLTVLMNKVVNGIPDAKGGYLERPLDTEARAFVADCGGELDAAVSAAAHHIFVRKPNWSTSVWRSALIVVVGQVPLVGSAAALFYGQFESLWKQLRFAALAATIYGHDARDDATQCQIILCLLDDKIRKRSAPGAMEQIYSGGIKSGVQVAATVVAREVVTKGSSGFMVRRMLGGLLAGVVPEAVGLLCTVFFSDRFMSTDAQAAARAKQLSLRTRSHFKKAERPGTGTARIAFAVWLVPTLMVHAARAFEACDRALVRAARLAAPKWAAGDAVAASAPVRLLEFSRAGAETAARALQLLGADDDDFAGVQSWIAYAQSLGLMLVWMLLKLALLVALAVASAAIVTRAARWRTWIVSTGVLGVKSALSFLSALSTAESLCLAVGGALLLVSPGDGGVHGLGGNEGSEALYHAHRAAVGLLTIAARVYKPLKRAVPVAVASLLLWILFHTGLIVVAYARALAPAASLDDGDGAQTTDLFQWTASAWQPQAHEPSRGAFAWARVRDALSALTTVALHVLLGELQRADVVMTLLGPRKVVEGLLFAAKSLGHVVARPHELLEWLDRTTPPQAVSWALLSAQVCATALGLVCGALAGAGLLSARELALLCYGVMATVPLALWQRPLPPPHQERMWSEALRQRHRLLYLIPELDSGARAGLHFAISFFEHYHLAVSRSQELLSTSSFGRVRDWVSASFATAKSEPQMARDADWMAPGSGSEEPAADPKPPPLEFDVGVYYEDEDTWKDKIRNVLSRRNQEARLDADALRPLDDPDLSQSAGEAKNVNVEEPDKRAGWREWAQARWQRPEVSVVSAVSEPSAREEQPQQQEGAHGVEAEGFVARWRPAWLQRTPSVAAAEDDGVPAAEDDVAEAPRWRRWLARGKEAATPVDGDAAGTGGPEAAVGAADEAPSRWRRFWQPADAAVVVEENAEPRQGWADWAREKLPQRNTAQEQPEQQQQPEQPTTQEQQQPEQQTQEPPQPEQQPQEVLPESPSPTDLLQAPEQQTLQQEQPDVD